MMKSQQNQIHYLSRKYNILRKNKICKYWSNLKIITINLLNQNLQFRINPITLHKTLITDNRDELITNKMASIRQMASITQTQLTNTWFVVACPAILCVRVMQLNYFDFKIFLTNSSARGPTTDDIYFHKNVTLCGSFGTGRRFDDNSSFGRATDGLIIMSKE